jgi:hypothetical protein
MTPTTILIIEAFIRYGPIIGSKVQDFISRKDIPTAEEWEALFAEASVPYDQGKAAARAELEAAKKTP